MKKKNRSHPPPLPVRTADSQKAKNGEVGRDPQEPDEKTGNEGSANARFGSGREHTSPKKTRAEWL